MKESGLEALVRRIVDDPSRIRLTSNVRISGRIFDVRAWKYDEGAVGLYVRPHKSKQSVCGGKHGAEEGQREGL